MSEPTRPMISDYKRREVAQELRALDMSDIEVDGCIVDSPKYVGLLLMRMIDVVCDYRDGLHYFPGFFSAQAVVELFADLIDRPTCEWLNDGRKLTPWRCAVCGCERSAVPNYCPNCGSMVVMGDGE